jgi:hypothetical protein
MQNKKLHLLIGLLALVVSIKGSAITCLVLPVKNIDTTAPTKKVKDSLPLLKPHNPRLALKRSAILPGWGQVYNKQWWKVPIIYGALGVTAGIFVYNVQWYRRCRFAANARATNNPADVAKIHPRLTNQGLESLRILRNSFRRDVDFSVLFFLIFWGLNVADAVVFAHLKDFDVNDNLSLRFNIGQNTVAQNAGVGISLRFKGRSK